MFPETRNAPFDDSESNPLPTYSLVVAEQGTVSVEERLSEFFDAGHDNPVHTFAASTDWVQGDVYILHAHGPLPNGRADTEKSVDFIVDSINSFQRSLPDDFGLYHPEIKDAFFKNGHEVPDRLAIALKAGVSDLLDHAAAFVRETLEMAASMKGYPLGFAHAIRGLRAAIESVKRHAEKQKFRKLLVQYLKQHQVLGDAGDTEVLNRGRCSLPSLPGLALETICKELLATSENKVCIDDYPENEALPSWYPLSRTLYQLYGRERGYSVDRRGERHLGFLRACKKLWKIGSRILYASTTFIFHGSAESALAFLHDHATQLAIGNFSKICQVYQFRTPTNISAWRRLFAVYSHKAPGLKDFCLYIEDTFWSRVDWKQGADVVFKTKDLDRPRAEAAGWRPQRNFLQNVARLSITKEPKIPTSLGVRDFKLKIARGDSWDRRRFVADLTALLRTKMHERPFTAKPDVCVCPPHYQVGRMLCHSCYWNYDTYCLMRQKRMEEGAFRGVDTEPSANPSEFSPDAPKFGRESTAAQLNASVPLRRMVTIDSPTDHEGRITVVVSELGASGAENTLRPIVLQFDFEDAFERWRWTRDLKRAVTLSLG